MKFTSARQLAHAASVASQKNNSHLQDVFASLLEGLSISQRDRALAETIAFGELRHRLSLDLVVSAVSSRGIAKIQSELLLILRQGIFQLYFLDRIPDHAVLNETVNLAKKTLGVKVGAFANAVLRSSLRLIKNKRIPRKGSPTAQNILATEGSNYIELNKPILPVPENNLAKYLAALYGYPEFMVSNWLEAHPRAVVEGILDWGNNQGALTVRINSCEFSDWPVSDIDAANIFEDCDSFEAGEVEGSYRLNTTLPPHKLSGLQKGFYSIQDETQIRPALCLAPNKGDTVLDLCAGRGGKSMHLAELVGVGGKVIALDTNLARLDEARQAALRLGLENIEFIREDARHYKADNKFTHILLDAPCSNLGSLARRVEVRHRTGRKDIRSLAKLQRELIEKALGMLKIGGKLLYSVCSFEKIENGLLIDSLLQNKSNFKLMQEHTVLPVINRRDGGYTALITRES